MLHDFSMHVYIYFFYISSGIISAAPALNKYYFILIGWSYRLNKICLSSVAVISESFHAICLILFSIAMLVLFTLDFLVIILEPLMFHKYIYT